MTLQNIVTLDHSKMASLLADDTIVALLPCLAAPQTQINSIKPGNPNCSKCQASKNRIRNTAIQTAKGCIINSRGEQLEKLKERLQAKQIRLVLSNTAGSPTTYTL